MLVLKDYLIDRLPRYILTEDSYQDSNGKGFIERYLAIFGEELDDNTLPKLEEIENLANPILLNNPNFLEYHSFLKGDLDITSLALDNSTYRNLLTYILSIYKAKGTLKSYKAILGLLKITDVEIEPIVITAGGYDSGVTYDDGTTFYDGVGVTCQRCFEYNLILTGIDTITSNLFNNIIKLVKLVEPINARLKDIDYNDSVIEETPIEVYVDGDGDLIYVNDKDPLLVLELVNGDLVISGPNANQYYLDNQGNLIYIN